MAKKIRFPLILKDDYQVKDLEELQAHFDLDKILNYYSEGKLQQWLQDRYYESEYTKITELSPSSPRLADELCSILGVEYRVGTENREKGTDKGNIEADKKKEEELRRKAREEAERKVREEQERKIREETERKIREEAERKVRAEIEEKIRRETEQKAREEAERRAREELERRAREEAERKAYEEAERRAREEAEQKARRSMVQTAEATSSMKRAVISDNRGPAKPQQKKKSYLAVLALICSILAWFTADTIILPVPLAITGIVLGNKSRKSGKKKTATAGIVIGSLLIGLYIIVICMAIITFVNSDSPQEPTVETSRIAETFVADETEKESKEAVVPGWIETKKKNADTQDTVAESRETDEVGETSTLESSEVNEPLTQKETEPETATAYSGTVWPDSGSTYYDQRSAELLSYDDLKEAISEIYERYGINIRDEDKSEYFSEEPWYRKQLKEVGFDDSTLNEFEQNNMEILDSELQKRKEAEEEEAFLLPGSDRIRFMGYVIGDRLGPDNKELMQLAIYEIYARHGMIFEDQNVAAYFSDKSWYVGEIPEAEFDYSVLNIAELENIETMENIIKYRD